jgi:hypothetical protein
MKKRFLEIKLKVELLYSFMTKIECGLLYIYTLSGILILFHSGTFVFALLVCFTLFVSFYFGLYFIEIESRLTTKSLSFQERVFQKIAYFKYLWIHPEYVNLKNFWIEDFKKAYKNVPVYHLIWHVPYILLISLYTLFDTRLKPFKLIFFVRSLYGIMELSNLYCLLALSSYLYVLFILTLIAIFSPLRKHIIKYYGPDCIKKLGFNSPLIRASGDLPALGKIAAGIATGVAGKVGVNTVLNDAVFSNDTTNYKADVVEVRAIEKEQREYYKENPDSRVLPQVFEHPVKPDRRDPKYNRDYFYSGLKLTEIAEVLITKPRK